MSEVINAEVALERIEPAPLALEPTKIDVQALLFKAVERDMPIEALREIFEMAKDLQKYQDEQAEKERARIAKAEFDAALALVQKLVPAIPKKRRGGGDKYMYASLDDIYQKALPVLNDHGFQHTSSPIFDFEGQQVTGVSILTHQGGHSERRTWGPIPVESIRSHEGRAVRTVGQDWAAQATFTTRYAFLLNLGIVPVSAGGDLAPAGGNGTPRQHVPPPREKPSEQAKKAVVANGQASKVKIHPSAPEAAISAAQVKVLTKKMSSAGLDSDDFEKRFGFGGLENVAAADVNHVLAWVSDPVGR